MPASFSRLPRFDQRGTGASDPPPSSPVSRQRSTAAPRLGRRTSNPRAASTMVRVSNLVLPKGDEVRVTECRAADDHDEDR